MLTLGLHIQGNSGSTDVTCVMPLHMKPSWAFPFPSTSRERMNIGRKERLALSEELLILTHQDPEGKSREECNMARGSQRKLQPISQFSNGPKLIPLMSFLPAAHNVL